MHRWIRGVSRLTPNSSESNSPIILFSSFHRSNPIEVDKLKSLAATFPILHRTYTQQNTSSPRRSRTPPAYSDFVHVVKTTGGGGIGVSVYKRKLPKKLAQRVVKLTCESTAKGGVCDVYLVGTNHFSAKSRQEVQAVINVLKPQVVFLELCSSRVGFLTQNLEVSTYGGELRVGFDEAMKYGGKVILGDRPGNITMRRTWARLPLWHKTKLITSSVFLRAFSSSRIEIINRIELKLKQYPTLLETYIHERDKYMSYALLRVASEHNSEHNSVVAVVGKAHLDGIRKHWKEPIEEQQIRDLLEMPVSKPGVIEKKILKFLGVAE